MYQSQFIEMFGGNKVDYVQLSSLCSTFIDGDWIESKDQSESGIRLIQTGNVGCGEYKDKGDKAKYITEDTFNKLHCTEIYPGDILISRLPDPVGRACVLPEGLGKCVTAVDCTIIRFSEKILPNFFVAYTNTPEYLTQIKSTLAGTTRLRVSRGNLGKVKIPVPSIEQQRTFVSIAEQADKSKFSCLKSQFIEMFGKSSLTIEMQECFSMIRNGANIKQGQVEGGFPITRIETISDETIDREKMGYAGIIDNKYESYYLQEGDILVSHINSMKHIGKCALYCKQEDEIIIHGMNLLCLRPIREIVVPAFAIHMLRSDIIKKQIADITKPAVNQASFSVRDFGGIKAIIPNNDEQNKFVAIAQQADKSKQIAFSRAS